MFQGPAYKTIRPLAVLPVGDDLTGGGTVGICGGRGGKNWREGESRGMQYINHGQEVYISVVQPRFTGYVFFTGVALFSLLYHLHN